MAVSGTRPKAARRVPLIYPLRRHADRIRTIVALTSQYPAMLDQVMDSIGIQADCDLNVMKADQTLTDTTRGVLNADRPRRIRMHGQSR